MAISRFDIPLLTFLSLYSINIYLAFGFVAALLESLPVIGLAFSISNRIGAAMWAHDLEKRQHLFASGELRPLSPRSRQITHQEELIVAGATVMDHSKHDVSETRFREREPGQQSQLGMAGSWEHEEIS